MLEQAVLLQGQDPRKLHQEYVTRNFQQSKPAVKTMSNTMLYADLLRRAYYKLATSHEGFYTLRRQFVLSYALLCISHYILGIGDRHQSKYVLPFLYPDRTVPLVF